MFDCLSRFLTYAQSFRSCLAIPQPFSNSAAFSLISMFHVSFWETNHMGTWEWRCWRFLCYWLGQQRHAYLRSTRIQLRSTKPAQTVLRELKGYVTPDGNSSTLRGSWETGSNLGFNLHNDRTFQITHGPIDVLLNHLISMLSVNFQFLVLRIRQLFTCL